MARKSKAQKQEVFEFGNAAAWVRLSHGSKTGQWLKIEWGGGEETHDVVLRGECARHLASLIILDTAMTFRLGSTWQFGTFDGWRMLLPADDGRYFCIKLMDGKYQFSPMRDWFKRLFPAIAARAA